MSNHPVISHMPKEERIRAIAYAIWEEEGRPEGRAEEHWFRACELVEAEAPAPAEPEWLKRVEVEEPAEAEIVEPERKVA